MNVTFAWELMLEIRLSCFYWFLMYSFKVGRVVKILVVVSSEWSCCAIILLRRIILLSSGNEFVTIYFERLMVLEY